MAANKLLIGKDLTIERDRLTKEIEKMTKGITELQGKRPKFKPFAKLHDKVVAQMQSGLDQRQAELDALLSPGKDLLNITPTPDTSRPTLSAGGGVNSTRTGVDALKLVMPPTLEIT